MNISKHIAILLFTLSLALGLSGCFLAPPTGPGAWDRAEVSPMLICSQDPVNVSWRATRLGCLGDGCPPPPTVDIVSQPDQFSGNPIASFENFGARIIHPEEDTSITFDGTVAGVSLQQRIFNIELVLPEARTTVAGEFAGVCLSRQGVWAPLTFLNSRSDRVSILRICNSDRAAIILDVDFGGRTQQFQLSPNDCTDPEFSDIVVSATARPVISFDPSFSSNCNVDNSTITGTPPRSISADVVLFCRSQ